MVGATVPEATNLDSSTCATGTPNVTDFGSVTPGSSVVTSADCIVTFGSSNSTAMLRLSQEDTRSAAMVALPPAADVVGLWHLDGSLADSSGTGSTITPTGAALVHSAGTPGYGQGVDLDSTHTGLASASAAFDLTAFTVDGWFKTTSPGPGGYYAIIQKGTEAPYRRNFGIQLIPAATWAPGYLQASMTINGGTGVSVATPYASVIDGAWHHFAMVASSSGGTLALYVDGTLAASNTFTGTIDTPATVLGIGRYPVNTTWPLTASVDELRIQKVARTASEIQSYYVRAVDDYASGSADWATPGAQLFGACLASVAGTGATNTWPLGGACPATDSPAWRAIPTTSGAAAAKVASSTTSGTTGASARLRFGLRTAASQRPGVYRAGLTFTVIAPDA